jgi:hypothetical protein
MLKATMGGLVIFGLSFGNIEKFKAEPDDTFIRIKGEEVNLPLDVILCSGPSMRGISKDKKTGKDVIFISLDSTELNALHTYPGRSLLTIQGATIGLAVNIIIFSGETEAAMTEWCTELITRNTKTTISKRLLN